MEPPFFLPNIPVDQPSCPTAVASMNPTSSLNSAILKTSTIQPETGQQRCEQRTTKQPTFIVEAEDDSDTWASTFDIEEEMVHHTRSIEARRNKEALIEKQNSTVEESGDFDDSSDEDYILPEDDDDDVSIESDAPSEELEDIEGSSEDDIFMERASTKKDRVNKLKKMLNKSTRRNPRLEECRIDKSTLGWYSDAEDEDNIENLDHSSEIKNGGCPMYIEGEGMKNKNLEVCMKFPNVDVYREALKDWVIRNGYELQYLKNERKRITAKCNAEGCNWRIHASVVQGGPLFQVKTISGEHSCAKTRVNKHANAKYIGKRLAEGIKDNPDVPILKLQSSIMRKVGVEAGYWKAMRAKRAALDKVRGQDEAEYKLLWDYCETVRSANPDSKILLSKVSDSQPPIFEKMYFSLNAMRRGFLDGCRTLIGLDGCFLKTYHGGQLLCAVGRDGNDNLFPIAIAVVPIENREMWTWFVRELLEDIGGVNEQKWTFISDRQKGLLETLKELAPGCAHRFCVRHIYQNFRLKWPSYELKLLLWKAASTGNTREFEKQMTEIQKVDSAAATWLKNIPPCHWTRSHFTTSCKSDVLVNNMCESFNNMILQARGKPIISMFEWIRTRMSTRYQTKKIGIEKYTGTLCPSILRKINKYHKLARNCYPRWCGRDEFEVECFMEKYVVYLDKRTCTCGIFQLNGYPCAHAWSCIADRRYKVEDYVDHWYTKEKYMKVYDNMIHAVPGSRDYIRTPYEPLQAPVLKKKIGRPKKKRVKASDEVRVSCFRSGLKHKCQKCRQLGHNKNTCNNPTHHNSKLYKENSITKATPNPRERAPGVLAHPVRNCDQEIMVVNSTAPQSSQLQPRVYKSRENSVVASSSSVVDTQNF